VVISNDGDAPADDVRAEILFSAGLEVTDIPPTWPVRPELRALEAAGKLGGGRTTASRYPSTPTPFLMDWAGGFRRRRLRIRVERLMQTKLIARQLWTWPEPHVTGFPIDVEVLAASPALLHRVTLDVQIAQPANASDRATR
jgi:hypothetical protein